jgi:hypothetical protein
MEFHFNVQNVKALETLNEIGDHVGDKKLMTRLAQLLILGIKTRTAEGKDYQGKPFQKYTEKYRHFREKEGRPTDVVDLFFKGHMMGAMTHRVLDGMTAEIFFSDAQQGAKAHGHFYGYPPHGLPPRKFFAASQEDLDKMAEEAKKFLLSGELGGLI